MSDEGFKLLVLSLELRSQGSLVQSAWQPSLEQGRVRVYLQVPHPYPQLTSVQTQQLI